ncbi:hypothetical protein OPQ81_008133 [Rhizoctonia solani]|nr:hypothetical protein OPQ81_008133 [Rhizoctonia solani]
MISPISPASWTALQRVAGSNPLIDRRKATKTRVHPSSDCLLRSLFCHFAIYYLEKVYYMEPHNQDLSYMSDQAKSHTPPNAEQVQKNQDPTSTRKRSLAAWIETVWALVTHTTLSAAIVVFVLYYVQGRPFNITYRKASVPIIGGEVALQFAPIQSDVVTMLSCFILVQKWAITAWVTTISWRIAIFLMEKSGIHRQDFRALIKYRLLTPGTFLTSLPTLIVGTLLLANLAANLSTPILTGSISWVPTNHAVRGLNTNPIQFDELEAGALAALPEDYINSTSLRASYIERGIGLIAIAWGRGTERLVHKRVTSSVEVLGIGSTIEKVTLPYFATETIKWIENENELPNYARGDLNPDSIVAKAAEWTPGALSGLPFGYVALIPDLTNPTNWASDTMNSKVIKETRLLVLLFKTGIRNLTRVMPPNIYTQEYLGNHYAFAWVSFRAGVGKCQEYQCIVSSPSTIQNQVEIALEPHPLTFQALSMAMVISINLVSQNASIPFPWANIEDYMEAVLVRSYSGAWNILNGRIRTSTMSSGYDPALPGLVARVNHRRVYGWLGVQLVVTFLGIAFFILQSGLSEFPLLGDTALMAFYMDTTGVQKDDIRDPYVHRVVTIQQDGERLIVAKVS